MTMISDNDRGPGRVVVSTGAIEEESAGLGDTVHKITKALHIPECGGCKKRRLWLNKAIPYKRGKK